MKRLAAFSHEERIHLMATLNAVKAWTTAECQRWLAHNRGTDDRMGQIWVMVLKRELRARAVRRAAQARTSAFFARSLLNRRAA